MKAIFLDGPKDGLIMEVPDDTGPAICFAIPQPINWLAGPKDSDPYGPTCGTAVYYRVLTPKSVEMEHNARWYRFGGMQ